MKHTIIELEEGALSLTLVTVSGKATRVESCFRMPFAELHPATLGSTLKALMTEVPDFDSVHVVLGERRIQHFVKEVPRLGVDDLKAFATREALRLGGMSAGAKLLLRGRVLGKAGGGRLRLAVTAMEAALWEPLAAAIAENGLKVGSLWSVEECLGMALRGKDSARVGVVDFSAARARFAVCVDGAPAQVRRFMVPGADVVEGDDTTMLTAQLAMEVPRTLEYLKETGGAQPDCLLLSHRIARADEDLQMFAEVGLPAARFVPAAELAPGQTMPGMATLGLVARLAAGRLGPSLLDGVTITIPASPVRLVVGLAAGLLGCVGVAGAMDVQGERAAAEAALAQHAGERRQLEQELADIQNPAPVVEVQSPDQDRIQEILARRRPNSLAVAGVANAAADKVLLDAIEFGFEDKLIITGSVAGETRLQAFMTLSEFTVALRELGYLASEGKEEVNEVEGSTGRLRFKFVFAWRKP